MKINDNVIKVILEQAKKDAPIESCGLLLGKDDHVTESYWMENIDHSEEHFSFSPKDQFAALKYARSKRLKILANWHGHQLSTSHLHVTTRQESLPQPSEVERIS